MSPSAWASAALRIINRVVPRALGDNADTVKARWDDFGRGDIDGAVSTTDENAETPALGGRRAPLLGRARATECGERPAGDQHQPERGRADNAIAVAGELVDGLAGESQDRHSG